MRAGTRVKHFGIFALLVAVAICLACAKNPKEFKITEKNKDTFLKEIKDMKGLTIEESRLLYAYVLRMQMGEAFGGAAPSMVGKSVGDIIATEREYEASVEKQQQEEARLSAEAKAKEEAKAEELRKSVKLSIFAKSFLESNYDAGRYSDYIIIKCVYENTSGKDIRAFTGTVRFADLFGKEMFSSGLTISDPIKAGQKANWTGTIEYNQFVDEHKALRNAELSDMQVVWLPREILFQDGTRLGAD